MSTTAKFWMVKGLGATKVEHRTREEAKKEARRLSLLNQGQVFHVLECVDAYVTTPVTVVCEVLERAEEMPGVPA